MSEQIEQEKTIHYNDAKIWQIAFFSMNNTAANLYLALMGYISYYANSMAGFSVVLISSLVTAMNIFDGVTDPVVGFLLDKSKGRFGKFRPFMVAGNILMAVSAVLLFATTHLIPKWVRIPYFIIIYAIFIIGYTFQTVVAKSGQTIITNNPKKRPLSTYFDSIFIMAAYGGSALFVANYLVPKYGGFTNEELYVEYVFWVVVLSALATLLAVIGIWKKDQPGRYEHQQTQKIKVWDFFLILKQNKPIRMLVIAAASNKFASMVYSNSTVLVMLFGILMNNYPLAGIIGVIVGIPNLGIIYLGIRYAKKVGQKKAMVVSTWFAIAFQAVMMYMMLFTDLTKVSLAEINGITIAFLLVFALLNGVKSITNNIVVPMIADCTDYEYTLSGHFVPGIMGALFSFIDKSFSALGTGFVGIALSMTGYAKVFPQVGDALTPQLKYMTVFFYCVIPILGWFVTIFIMRFYRLDKKAMSILYTKKGQKE
mgnify:CR=1 FL=1